ncbi:glycosyltransferase [Rhodococcus sp. IEGM 1408]|uniref:glycosyltransferase n=1 Tax=Rhodococcus sp. IEGM 1408 TaxID=3082220 RepID=UPI0029533CEB|nr:glycosyltransferase [Rhodococcus sp. IEGM 1408]MDV7999916.1 glycosyltransferase [Rhodococcus sp. IEGM 1408]
MGAQNNEPLDIAVIAPSRFPIREPYAGGLEVVVAKEVRALRERGHRVTLFAAEGSDGHEPRFEFTTMASAAGFGDSFYPPGGYESDAAEFHRLMDHLAVSQFDVILNHSLSHVPLLRAVDVGAEIITTLHCPQLSAMQEAFDQQGSAAGRVLAVSRSVLKTWRLPRGAEVIPNGVDTRIWRPQPHLQAAESQSPRGAAEPPRAVWSGRIVPEKAPHLAVDAALRAGLTLDLAGRIGDNIYMREVLAPRLRRAGNAVRVHGALGCDSLVPLVAGASVALVTPCWEEPFGLTAVEALACGTPVVALARGGIREILSGQPGVVLVEPGRDPASGLAAAIPTALTRDRAATARAAAATFSHETRIDRVEARLRGLLVGAAS